MDVAAEDQCEELDDLPSDFPIRRPRTYGYCMAVGLGTEIPCPFASCRHSLLSDEFRGRDKNGQMHSDDVDLWTIETCSLAVARRGVSVRPSAVG